MSLLIRGLTNHAPHSYTFTCIHTVKGQRPLHVWTRVCGANTATHVSPLHEAHGHKVKEPLSTAALLAQWLLKRHSTVPMVGLPQMGLPHLGLHVILAVKVLSWVVIRKYKKVSDC